MANQSDTKNVKYRFGHKDLDMNNYIHNLGINLQSYMDSKGWDDNRRSEFMNSYNQYLKGFEDQLANNTNRFSTDDAGAIIDNQGLLSEVDDDGIDPNGSQYYYNDKGERITTDDLNTMREKKRKKYNPFLANREVAKYFNIIGNALPEMKAKPEDTSNKFNLAKHGFISYWQGLNNPSGGKMDLRPYLDKDVFDKTTGKRARTNRANYLAGEIRNYLAQLKDYDFADTTFTDSNIYKQRLADAAKNLEYGNWDNNDIIALNQAGIGGDFQTAFFSEEENPNLTAEQKQNIEDKQKAEEEAKKKEEQQKAFKAYVDNEMSIYDANKYQYNQYNPFYTNRISRKFLNDDGTFNYKAYGDSIKIKGDSDNYYKNLVNNFLVNPFDSKNNGAALAIMLDNGYARKMENGTYYIPRQTDRQTRSALVYDPTTGKLHNTFIGDIASEWNSIVQQYKEANGLVDRADKYAKLQQGGTIQNQIVGNFDFDRMINDKRKERLEKEGTANTLNTSYHSGRTAEQEEAGNRKTFADATLENPDNGFSGTDLIRLGTIAADIVSMGAAFAPPGVGTVVSATTGIVSSMGTFFADAFEDGPDWGDVKSLGANLGMDFLGMIPGGGAASKGMKIAKNLGKYATRVIATVGALHTVANGDKIIASYSKLLDSPSELNVDDWRNISAGLGLITGGVTAGSRKYQKAKKEAANARPDNVAVEFVDKAGKKQTIAFAGEDAAAIRKAQSSGSMEDVKKVTTQKYENLRNLDISTNSDFGYRGFRKDGKWQIPVGAKDGKMKIYDIAVDKQGLYAKTKTFQDDQRISNIYTDQGANKKLLSSEVDAQIKADQQALIDPMIKGSKNIEQGLTHNKEYLTKFEESLKGNKTTLNGRTSADLIQHRKNINDEADWLKTNDIRNKLAQRDKYEVDIKDKQTQIDDLEAKIKAGDDTPANNAAKDQLIAERDAIIAQRDQFDTDNTGWQDWKQRVTTNDADVQNLGNLGTEISTVQALEQAITKDQERIAKLRKRISDVEAGKVRSKAYEDFKSKYVTGSGDDAVATFKSPSAFRDDIKQSFKELLKANGIIYKQGGSLNLSNVRKFQKAGKITNTSSTANWFSDMFQSKHMQDWLNTFNQDNYENFNNLQSSWKANLDATKYKPGVNPVEYNQGVYDRQGLWNATNTNSVISNLQNNGVITTRGNSGDNKEDNYQDGYFGEQEFLRHGGSKDSWIGHEQELKAFQDQLATKGLTYTLNPNGMYQLGLLNSSTPQTSPQTNPQRAINRPVSDAVEVDNNNTKNSKLELKAQLLSNPTLSYGLPRALAADRANRRMTDLAIASEKPFYQDPYEKSRSIMSGLDYEIQGQNAAGMLNNMASQPITSDLGKQLAAGFEATTKGIDYINAGKTKSNEIYRQNAELARQDMETSTKNRHDVAMQNRLAGLQTQQNKSKLEQAYQSRRFTIYDTLAQQLEHEAKQKQIDKQALTDKFAASDIHNAVQNNLKNYVKDLSPDEETVWNQVITGAVKVSDLTNDPVKYNAYLSAWKKASQVEQDQLRIYKGIPENSWTNVRTMVSSKQPFTPKLEKNGGKIAVAGIRAKTEEAKLFQKSIKESIDRNEKTLARVSKSLYNYIKASIVK